MARRRVEPVPPPGRIEREERERAERRREEEARRIGEADIKRRRAEYKKARKDEEMLLAAAKRKKNRPYLFISGAFLLLFISLIGYLAYFNVVMRDRILANPYNKRQETLNEYVIRGDIVSRDGEVLAHTEIGEDGNETRVYPYGRTFAHIVGFSVKGRSGIESIMNYDLLSSHNAVVDRILNEFEGTRNPGDIIVTSLDTDVQSAACSALGDRQGAVVVMRPSSGEVYAMVSKPDFEPNTIDADWEAIVGDETGSQLLNRALQGLYPPGSTFKIGTALGYMRANPDFENFIFNCEGFLTSGDATIHCSGESVHGEENLESAFANSCNSAFASIGLTLGPDKLRSAAEDLLFNKELPVTLSNRSGKFSLKADDSDGTIMRTAFGQGSTLTTPFHMALIASGIANDGVVMQPRLIMSVKSRDETWEKQEGVREFARIMSGEEAEKLTSLMRSVVTSGTGASLADLPFEVCGKTGSAEYGRADGSTGTHGWFVGFSKELDVSFAVLVEDGGSGSESAVPIARIILETIAQKR